MKHRSLPPRFNGGLSFQLGEKVLLQVFMGFFLPESHRALPP